MFRIYDKDHNFTDYDLFHHDLDITIEDDDAEFVENDEGKKYLDYSRQTLGKDADGKTKD